MKKRILSMLLVIVMVLSMVPVSALAEGETLEIVSSGATKNFVMGRDTEFTLSLKEGENTVSGVTWSAEPTGVVNPMALATGKLIGWNPGDVTVTATYDGRTVTKDFSVYKKPTNLQIAKVEAGAASTLSDTENLKKDAEITVKYLCDNPADVELNTICGWKLLDNADGVLAFDETNLKLTALKAGTAKLRVAVNGSEKIVTFNVTEDVVGHITAAPEVKKLTAGDTVKLTVGFTGSEPYPDGDAITWTCTSDAVVLTRNGKECTVLGKTPTTGEIEIVARWTGNCVAYKLQVVDAAPLSIAVGENPVSELTLTGSKEQKTLTVTGLPEGKTSADIEWGVASGEDVLNVTRKGTDLEVSGVKAGTAVVTAKIKGLEGTQASVTITVQPKATITNKPEDGEKVTLYVGDTFTCELEPELVDAKELTLVPSDTEAVEINANAITAKKAATGVKISLMKGETEFDSFLLDIEAQARVVIDSKMSQELLCGEKLDLKATVLDSNGAVLEGKTVRWEFTDAKDENLAILANGVLTAKPHLTVPDDVELQAVVDDKELDCESAKVTIHLIPRTVNIAIKNNDLVVTDKVVSLNLSDEAARTNGIEIVAEVTPAGATQSVTWNVEPSNLCRKEVVGDNTLRLYPISDQKTGTVIVTAAAGDGTGVTAKTTVNLSRVANSLEILNAPEYVCGGVDIQLRTNLDEDKTLTDRRVVWSVREEDKQYASVTESGFLDTAAVTQRTTIKVKASMIANPALESEKTITLCPAVKTISIMEKVAVSEGEPVLMKMKNVLPFTTDKIYLGMEVKPSGAYVADGFEWRSSNTAVAEVDSNGVLSLKDAGKVHITCTAKDGSNTIGTLDLEIVKAAGIVDIDGVDELISGKNTTLKATVYTDDGKTLAGNQKVTWSVEDVYGNPTKAATINSRGRLYAKTVNYGTEVVVYATSVEDKEVIGQFHVNILPKKEKAFAAFLEDDDRIIEAPLYMNTNETAVISGRWYFRDINDFIGEEDCLFFSSNPAVATIDQNDGMLATKKNGSTTITVRATDPDTRNVYTAKFTLHVVNTVDHIVISKPNNTPNYVRSGSYMYLSATVWSNVIETIKADNQGVTWGVYEYAGELEDESPVGPPIEGSEKAGGVVVDPSLLTATKAAYMTSNGALVAYSVTENKDVVVVATSKENPSITAEFPMQIRPAKAYTVTAGYEDDEGEFVIPTGAVNMEVVYNGDAVELSSEAPDITAKVYASDLSPAGYLEDPKIVWETSDKKIVKIDEDGQLEYTGKTGKVKVTPTFKAGNTTYRGNTLTLNIIKPVEEIEVTKKYANQELYSGKSLLMYAIVDENATTRRVTWSLIGEGDSAVASINPTTGLIRARKGLTEQVEITVQAMATDGSGETDELDVIIYPLATKVMITSTFKTIEVGDDEKQVTAQVLPFAEKDGKQLGANQEVKWSSSRSSVLAVDEDGNLTAKRRGTATIKAKATDGSGKYATIKITVVAPTAP